MKTDTYQAKAADSKIERVQDQKENLQRQSENFLWKYLGNAINKNFYLMLKELQYFQMYNFEQNTTVAQIVVR